MQYRTGNVQLCAFPHTATLDYLCENQFTSSDLQIRVGDASVAKDAQTVASLARIVNDAYGEAEADIFLPGYRRTSEPEIVKLIQEGCLLIAYLPANQNPTFEAAGPTALSETPSLKPVGCVFVKQLSTRLGNFGMLALDSKYRGRGLGRAMIDFAEYHCREKGCTVMQMELLVPTSFEHEVKSRMQDWYQRMGYRIIKLGSFDQDYPYLAALLATPADYKVFEKVLI
ncbi:hypothetical protein E4U41_001269 [Claviceps citrina]|nr:hypothetical protein E4U41_001269 [Claviceps citrina]